MSSEKIKQSVLQEMKVQPHFSVTEAISTRIAFIQNQLKQAQMHCIVLGISGGIDSSTCGRLCQLAVEGLRQEDPTTPYQFIAVRLPYGIQKDENDAQNALAFIQADAVFTVNIKQGVDALHETILNAAPDHFPKPNNSKLDFVKGNTKARLRMCAQFEIAALYQGLVAGTDHSAENLMGFYTKYGDGACDLAPLFGLNKRQVKHIAQHLGASEALVNKTPTADLEDDQPLKADELALGVTYHEIDDFLEGKTISSQAEECIINTYLKTQHKRQPIPTP